MAFDSSTRCARTAAGDAELTLPALGLSLGQRRILTLLQNASAVDEFAQRHRLEPAKLHRDLSRLADLRLVVLQGATNATPPAPASAAVPMAPVVIGGTTRRSRAMAFAAGITALIVATGIWFETRSDNVDPGPAPAAVVATLAPTAATISEPPLTAPSRTANDAASVVGVPATATILRGNVAPPERRAEIRPGLAPPAANLPAPAPAPLPVSVSVAVPIPAPVPMPRPELAIVNNPPVIAPPVTTSPAIIAAVAAPAVADKPSPAQVAATNPVPVVVEKPPPVQLAAANPAPALRPAAPTPLKAISREPPDFPKEAIVDGLKTGVVTARLHVDARGKVTGVDILGAQPPRVFDRAVRKALLQWQFEPPATGAAVDVDVDVKFQRD